MVLILHYFLVSINIINK